MNPAIFYTVLPEQSKKRSPHDLTHHNAVWYLFHRGSCLLNLLPEEISENRLPLVSYGAHGKPYLKDHPDIHFSLSHAGRIAVCVFADEEIGLDVQDHRDIGPRKLLQIADRFFSAEERESLRDVPKEERPDTFYRLWAAKEAYAKYTGNGMQEDFSSFTADPDLLSVSRDGAIIASLAEVSLSPDYSLFLCAAHPFGEILTERL